MTWTFDPERIDNAECQSGCDRAALLAEVVRLRAALRDCITNGGALEFLELFETGQPILVALQGLDDPVEFAHRRLTAINETARAVLESAQ